MDPENRQFWTPYRFALFLELELSSFRRFSGQQQRQPTARKHASGYELGMTASSALMLMLSSDSTTIMRDDRLKLKIMAMFLSWNAILRKGQGRTQFFYCFFNVFVVVFTSKCILRQHLRAIPSRMWTESLKRSTWGKLKQLQIISTYKRRIQFTLWHRSRPRIFWMRKARNTSTTYLCRALHLLRRRYIFSKFCEN